MDLNDYIDDIQEFCISKTDKTIPDPQELIYWQSRKNRTFYVDYEIDRDDGTSDKLLLLTKTILQMNADEKDIPTEELKPIYIYVQSYGGDLDVSFNLADVITSSRIPIVTVAMGATMSAGFLIFIAGCRRYCFSHSNLLIHSGSSQLQGTAEQIASAQANYKVQLQQMKDFILSRTEIPEKIFNKNKNKDWYLTLDEIKEYNIATVVNDLGEII